MIRLKNEKGDTIEPTVLLRIRNGVLEQMNLMIPKLQGVQPKSVWIPVQVVNDAVPNKPRALELVAPMPPADEEQGS